ncbi:MAG: hemin uptake protein HemP [Mariniblastus sp.]|nr:hemin uptake protein HemP [Mariniblastus sp.]
MNDQNHESGQQDEKPAVSGHSAYAQQLRVLPFEDLAGASEEVWIENKGQLYRLQRTKQGKLILTK